MSEKVVSSSSPELAERITRALDWRARAPDLTIQGKELLEKLKIATEERRLSIEAIEDEVVRMLARS